jgi:type I restriction enzyme S subunit
MTKYRFDEIAINSTQKKKPTEEDKVYYIGLEHIDPGCFDVVRWGSDVAPTGDKLLMQKGDVLFGKRRAYQRKVAIAPFDGIFSAHGMVLRPNLKVIDANYFPFFISSDKFMDTAVRISVGGLSPTINWKDLARQEFELPSLDEQKVLAYKLWAAYRLKEAYKKLLVATDEIVKSQFIEMFGNPLSSKQKNELKRLGQCCIINPRRPNIALCDTDKVSFIPMPAVSEDGYLVDMADEEYGKVKKGFTYFENNDVLFAKITPCMENGKGAIAYGLTNGIGVGSTEFHVLRPINGISSPYWLLTLTRMPIFRERAAKNMSGTGGQKRVSASYLNHFMVGLPAIEEQRRFEAIYKQADKSKSVIQKALVYLNDIQSDELKEIA